MREKTLDAMLRDAEEHYFRLRAARDCRDRREKCPEQVHVWVMTGVVCGGGSRRNAAALGILLNDNGYQVWRCLACGTNVVAEYSSRSPKEGGRAYVQVITERDATQLASPSMAG